MLPRLTRLDVIVKDGGRSFHPDPLVSWLVLCAPSMQHFCLKRKSTQTGLRFRVRITSDVMELISTRWGRQLMSYEWFPVPDELDDWYDHDWTVPDNYLAQFPVLDHLGCFISLDSNVEAVANYLNELANRLTSLSLHMEPQWSHDLLQAIGSCSNLETVFLTFLEEEIENCTPAHRHSFPELALQGLRFLNHLHLDHFDHYSNDGFAVDIDALFQQSNFRLGYLALRVSSFTVEAAEALATRHSLVEAAFTYCESCDEALSLIARITSMVALSVRGCDTVVFTFLVDIPDTSALKLFVAIAGFGAENPDEIFDRIRLFAGRMPGCFVPCCFYGIREREEIESDQEVCGACKPRINDVSTCCVLSCLEHRRVLI